MNTAIDVIQSMFLGFGVGSILSSLLFLHHAQLYRFNFNSNEYTECNKTSDTHMKRGLVGMAFGVTSSVVYAMVGFTFLFTCILIKYIIQRDSCQKRSEYYIKHHEWDTNGKDPSS